MEITENYIEWSTDGSGDTLKGEGVILSVNDRKMKRRLKAMAKEHPRAVKIIAENRDGSLMARVPRQAIKVEL